MTSDLVSDLVTTLPQYGIPPEIHQSSLLVSSEGYVISYEALSPTDQELVICDTLRDRLRVRRAFDRWRRIEC
jgi:hypothetical protein